MSSSKGLAAWLKPKTKQTLTIEEKEERDLQRAIELSQQTQREENEQRARFELLAARTLEMSKRPYHRHDKEMPFVNGEEDDRFETLTNRIVKKEKMESSSRSQRRQRQREKEEKEKEKEKEKEEEEGDLVNHLQQEDHQIKEEEEEIVFDVEEIDQWLAEEEDDYDNVDIYNSQTDPLASSPPSPYLHQFNNDHEQQLPSESPSQMTPQRDQEQGNEKIDNDDNQDEVALCPLCRRNVSRSLLYQHTLGCSGDFSSDNTPIDDNIGNYENEIDQHEGQYTTTSMSSPSIRPLDSIPRRSSVIQESIKRKSSKSMAAGVIREQKRQKSLNISSARRPYNHYSLHDTELEEHFDTAGFGGNVSGLSWETRGQSRYR
ncbi:hypothetical protein INT45_006782 [Circinella minor]|uniref:Uncharacterized protein n=1 Tax=Circinella minor TaxID=1195481 RepID=A0A8H7S9W5_9FUNG|nr:hypothetical protein INT45_006782 [Circinella minor]